MNLKRRRRCVCCRQLFFPDARSRHRQEFCSRPACRKASRVLSQLRWRTKPENQDYWRGSQQVERVRGWRETHPEYWKRVAREGSSTLQDDCVPKNPLLVGLVATIARSTLQDDIVAACRRLVTKGRAILDKQTTARSQAVESARKRPKPA